jgi:hypothetical protein
MRRKKSYDGIIVIPTIRLSQKEYRLHNGIVQRLRVKEDGTQEWRQTKYQMNEHVMLITKTKVRNARPGDKPVYHLVFDSNEGIPSHANRDIKIYHGWCGTTPDVTIHAYGLRKIIDIIHLKCGDISIKLSRDLNHQNEVAITDEYLPVLVEDIPDGESGRPLTSYELNNIRKRGYKCAIGCIVLRQDGSPNAGVCYRLSKREGYINTGIRVKKRDKGRKRKWEIVPRTGEIGNEYETSYE